MKAKVIILVLLIFLLAGCPSATPTVSPVASPTLEPIIRPTVVLTSVPTVAPSTRLYLSYANEAPANLGLDCYDTLAHTWPEERRFDWSVYDRCLAQPNPAVMLTLPAAYMTQGGQGTVAEPYTALLLPTWLKTPENTACFTSHGQTYQTLRYGGEIKARLTQFLREAGARYASNPKVQVVRIAVGFDGESQPNKPQDNANWSDWVGFMDKQEQVATCATYKGFVQELAQAGKLAFPNQKVVVQTGVQPCATGTDYGWRRELFMGWQGTAFSKIGIGLNGLQPDRGDASSDSQNVNVAPWKQFSSGSTIAFVDAPVVFETGADILGGEYSGQDLPQVAYWTLLAGAGSGADILSLSNVHWLPYLSTASQSVLERMGDNFLWVAFRDAEYPTWNWNATNGDSGRRGDWTGNATVLPNASQQACAPWLKKLAEERNASVANPVWRACSGPTLPEPQVDTPEQRLYNRQARLLPANSQINIAVQPYWQYAKGEHLVKIKLTYLDVGSDALTLMVLGGNKAFQKGNSGLWKTTEWQVRTTLTNGANGSFLAIASMEGAEYLHLLSVEVIS